MQNKTSKEAAYDILTRAIAKAFVDRVFTNRNSEFEKGEFSMLVKTMTIIKELEEKLIRSSD